MADQSLAPSTQLFGTRIESLLAKKGSLLVKIFHSLGSAPASFGGSIAVSTLRLFQPGAVDEVSDGIRLEVSEGGQSEANHTTLVDLDEVDSLVPGLEYMMSLVRQCADHKGDYTEVIFSTKGNLQVGFYVGEGTKHLQCFVRSGHCTAYLPFSSLSLFRDLLVAGQCYLKSQPVIHPGFGQ